MIGQNTNLLKMIKGSRHQIGFGHELGHRLHINKPFPKLLLATEEDGGLAFGGRLESTATPERTRLTATREEQREQCQGATGHLALAGLDAGGGGAGGIGSGILGPTSAGAGTAAGAKSGSHMLFTGFSGGA